MTVFETINQLTAKAERLKRLSKQAEGPKQIRELHEQADFYLYLKET